MTADNKIETNQVAIAGEVISGFRFSHAVFGEDFYVFDLMVKRLSDVADTIPVIVSHRLVDVTRDFVGDFLMITGQFRSYNDCAGPTMHVHLSVFARELYPAVAKDYGSGQINIRLNGYVCKPPSYRKTPLGREITDLLLAVNRPYGKTDYIPCICWGNNAHFASTFGVGNQMQVAGRIQSREYQKKISPTETESRVTYEVSVSKIS